MRILSVNPEGEVVLFLLISAVYHVIIITIIAIAIDIIIISVMIIITHLVQNPDMRMRELSARNAKRAQCGTHALATGNNSPKRL